MVTKGTSTYSTVLSLPVNCETHISDTIIHLKHSTSRKTYTTTHNKTHSKFPLNPGTRLAIATPEPSLITPSIHFQRESGKATMLSKQENQLNLYCFKLLATLGVLPLEFTKLGFTHAPKWKNSIWFSLILMELCHVVFGFWLLVSKLGQNGVESIPSLTLDFVVIVAPLIAIFSSVQNFVVWPETTQRLLNHLEPNPELLKSQLRNGPLFGYTFLEVYTMFMARAGYPAGVALTVNRLA